MEQIDRRSSVQKTAFWQRHYEAWKASGLKAAGYCVHHEISVGAFGYWKRKFSEVVKPVIVPVSLESRLQESLPRSVGNLPLYPLKVHVGGRFVVEVGVDFDPAVLEKLLRSLEHVSCTF